MACSEIQPSLSAYYDGELADGERARIAQHLQECSTCAKELADFDKLSRMTTALSTLAPSKHIWNRIERQLDQQTPMRADGRSRGWSFSMPGWTALAATLLIAIGASWLTYEYWFAHRGAEIVQYVDAFRDDPEAAQQFLLAQFDSQAVPVEHAVQHVGYRPATADGLPDGYTVQTSYVLEMPCCTCVQTVCKRSDGTRLAIFEHADNERPTFGGCPEISASCNGKRCCLVEIEDQLAASWKRGRRYITLIGARDLNEVSKMVAWFARGESGDAG